MHHHLMVTKLDFLSAFSPENEKDSFNRHIKTILEGIKICAHAHLIIFEFL